ncbi:MAG TPA: CsbD family protein [Tepidiformaceae bacterium]
MNKTKVKGKTNKAVGEARERTGHAIGNDKVEADGLAQQAKGQTQVAIGDLKDTAGHVKDRVKKAVKR